MTTPKKKIKRVKTKARFFKTPRLEICRILIEELTNWIDAKKPSEEEFYRLVDRLAKIILNTPK